MGLTFCHILSSVVYRSVASVVCPFNCISNTSSLSSSMSSSSKIKLSSMSIVVSIVVGASGIWMGVIVILIGCESVRIEVIRVVMVFVCVVVCLVVMHWLLMYSIVGSSYWWINNKDTRVVYRQLIITIFRMPIYPMLNQSKVNSTSPNPGLWLVESGQASHEYWWEHISYA